MLKQGNIKGMAHLKMKIVIDSCCFKNMSSKKSCCLLPCW